jgi:putative addiction module component (TIGR02574 family)
METDPQAILDAALQLSDDERLAIVSRLLETLPPEDVTISLDDAQLAEELDRRFADGEEAVPWSDLKAEG